MRINATLDLNQYRLPIHQDPVSIQVTLANLDALSTAVGQRITTLSSWVNDLSDDYQDAADAMLPKAEGSNKEARDAWVRRHLHDKYEQLRFARAWLEIYEKTLKIIERRISLAILQQGAVRSAANLA